MKCPAICREIKLIISTITQGGILIKNKNLKMLLFLISSAHGWVTAKVGEQCFLPGGWIMHGQQKHSSSERGAKDGVRGTMTHRVSSYMSQRCSD